MSVIHIVDDEESVRSSLAFLLEMAGFSTLSYGSATALLSRADALEDGCVVTDLRMPDVDGVELVRRLRDAGATLPAIVVTGHADVQMAVAAIRSGAFDFIQKPFSEAAIVGSIKRAMDPSARTAEQVQKATVRTIVTQMTGRELEVLRGVVDGLPNKLIAQSLGITPQSVEQQRAVLMERMQIRDLPELVRVTIDVELFR